MIGTGLSSSIILANNVLSFGNIDINTAQFDDLDTIPEYQSPGSRQWGGRIANNTGYNNRHSDMGMIIAGDSYPVRGTEKTYNTERMYNNKFIFALVDIHSAAVSLPISLFTGDTDFDGTLPSPTTPMRVWRMLQLTTTFQTLTSDSFTSPFRIRSLNGGGFVISNVLDAPVWLVAYIHEVRNIVGA